MKVYTVKKLVSYDFSFPTFLNILVYKHYLFEMEEEKNISFKAAASKTDDIIWN